MSDEPVLLEVVWTEYVRYRAELRGFDLVLIEQIVRQSSERYHDAMTGRLVAVGRHGGQLVMIPYERDGARATPVTIHVTKRQQINYRIKSGRFRYE